MAYSDCMVSNGREYMYFHGTVGVYTPRFQL